MNETLEDIQRFYGSALANFDGDASPFHSAEDRLLPLLETQYRDKPTEKKKPQAAIIVGALRSTCRTWLDRLLLLFACGNGRASCMRCVSNPASWWFPTRKTAERFTFRVSAIRLPKIPKNSSLRPVSIPNMRICNWLPYLFAR